MSRLQPLALTLLAACLLAAAPAQADTGRAKCELEDIAGQGDAAWFYCPLHTLDSRDSVKGFKPPRCDRFRNFEAHAADYGRYSTYDYRKRPSHSFQLRDNGYDLRNEATIRMRVRVYVHRQTVKFVNYSPIEVRVSFYMRCPLSERS